MAPRPIERPPALIAIAFFQFAKAAFLLTVAALLWLDPAALPQSQNFSQLLFIAAHGHDLTPVLIPILGVYIAYVGVGLLRLRNGVRLSLAFSSAVTIAGSLDRLGLFNESAVTSTFERQTLSFLILLDLVVYLYLAFHTGVTDSFKHAKRATRTP